MTLETLTATARSRGNFYSIDRYLAFAHEYLQIIENPDNYEEKVLASNRPEYFFIRYSSDANDQRITRAINGSLWMTAAEFEAGIPHFKAVLSDLARRVPPNPQHRQLLIRMIYTTQQSVGAVLDSLRAGESNTARKLVGEIFEQFMRKLIEAAGVTCESGSFATPVIENGEVAFKAKYQHDLLLKLGDDLKVIGSVKTTSKDRIDKIFIDKFMYSRLTETDTPHIAVFLNDVQRGKLVPGVGGAPDRYRVESTFLIGKFKAYSSRLNPLDGVYYCDVGLNMISDPVVAARIKGIDVLFYDDLYQMILTAPAVPVVEDTGVEGAE